MDFDNPKVYGDTSISDGLVLNLELPTCKINILSKIASSLSDLFSQPIKLTCASNQYSPSGAFVQQQPGGLPHVLIGTV